ncbi:hypothetical protein PR048_021346 [Dryococelus australis]|uniref:Uncharacterized protein n=1 Tax=Dryococelus australis TaxID=614101 RepID=A0ABQ9GY12_9NEOP|nr:hypothetical protein PR048_021346 [Dryococelus australis]
MDTDKSQNVRNPPLYSRENHDSSHQNQVTSKRSRTMCVLAALRPLAAAPPVVQPVAREPSPSRAAFCPDVTGVYNTSCKCEPLCSRHKISSVSRSQDDSGLGKMIECGFPVAFAVWMRAKPTGHFKKLGCRCVMGIAVARVRPVQEISVDRSEIDKFVARGAARRTIDFLKGYSMVPPSVDFPDWGEQAILQHHHALTTGLETFHLILVSPLKQNAQDNHHAETTYHDMSSGMSFTSPPSVLRTPTLIAARISSFAVLKVSGLACRSSTDRTTLKLSAKKETRYEAVIYILLLIPSTEVVRDGRLASGRFSDENSIDATPPSARRLTSGATCYVRLLTPSPLSSPRSGPELRETPPNPQQDDFIYRLFTLESRRATPCGYNSSHPVWHALYECLQDILGDSLPFLLQPFHELSNGFWPRLTSPHPAIQFVPNMFYRVEIGALDGSVQSANIVVGIPLHSSP